MLDGTPHHTNPTWKIHTSASKHVAYDFFLLFRNFTSFVIAQTIPTFHPTWKKRDVG